MVAGGPQRTQINVPDRYRRTCVGPAARGCETCPLDQKASAPIIVTLSVAFLKCLAILVLVQALIPKDFLISAIRVFIVIILIRPERPAFLPIPLTNSYSVAIPQVESGTLIIPSLIIVVLPITVRIAIVAPPSIAIIVVTGVTALRCVTLQLRSLMLGLRASF